MSMATRPSPRPRQQRPAPTRQRGGYQPTVRFSQEMIRRAATAMREDFSTDVFRLAVIALQAAIRTENDLLELLRPNHTEHRVATSALLRQTDLARAVAHVR